MGATKMLLGETSPAVQENRAFGVQSLSGTGALRYLFSEVYFVEIGYLPKGSLGIIQWTIN